MRLIRSGRIDIHYEWYGEGPTVIFVHGAGANTLGWFQQIPELGKLFRCLLLDLRGYKNSRCPPDQFDPRYFVDDLLAVLDGERIERAAFACQDIGAWGVLPLAIRYPERVAAIVIGGSIQPVCSAETRSVLAAWLAAKRANAGGLRFSSRFAAERPDLVVLYRSFERLNSTPALDMLGEEAWQLAPEQLCDFKTPTLIVRGSEDELVTNESHRAGAALIPGAKVYTFEGAGEAPFAETPVMYNRVLHSFFRQSGWSEK